MCVVCLLRFNYGSLHFHHVTTPTEKKSNKTEYKPPAFSKCVPRFEEANFTLYSKWISQTPYYKIRI